jgi:Superfamily I DNA and RNA helicases and helicase subunits
MNDINNKLNIWKNRLLDLGKRNPLLNYRDTRRTNFKIKSPEIFNLWNSFVINKHPLEFPLVDEEQMDFWAAMDSIEMPEPNVKINKSYKEQQSTLRNIRKKAKTIMEEQGVHSLYLAFGFLRWTEKFQYVSYFDAPLILVPVTLNLESIFSPYVLSLHEDEIKLNPTLVYKMENDFGIKLPEFNSENNLCNYFEQLQKLVSAQKWEIIPEAGLGLFSFLKINMYHDLERHRQDILNSPIIRTLTGDTSASNYDLSFLNELNHDKISPKDTFQVVDADSSQQDAIICAQKGISFVLQGPPGTGKSQTITNIIAECLASGKKVLFVSEKEAALQVVYKRLKEAELGDFCLELHGHKAKKSKILDQLYNVCRLANSKVNLGDEIYQKLNQLEEYRNHLNDYATSIFTVIEPLHKTIYDINGELANLQSYEEVIFSILNVDIRKITPEIYNNYIVRLTQFANSISGLNIDYRDNPWRDAKVIPVVTNELRHDIKAYLAELIPQSETIQKIHDEINDKLGISLSTAYSDLEQNISLLDVSSKAPKILNDWIIEGNFSQLLQEVDENQKFQAEFCEQREKVFELQEDIINLEPSADFTRFHILSNESDIQEHISAIRSYMLQNTCYKIWLNYSDWSQIESLYSFMDTTIEAYKSVKQDISENYSQDIFFIDYNAIYNRFKSEYLPALKIFNGQYREDKALIHSFCRGSKKKYSDEEIIFLLEELKHIEELKAQFGETNIMEYNAILNDITQDYEKDVLSIDCNDFYFRFKSECVSAFKFFNRTYRSDKKLIQGFHHEIGKKLSDQEILTLLGKLRRLKQLEEQFGKDNIEQYNTLSQKIEQNFDSDILSIDYNEIYFRFKSQYPPVIDVVTGQYCTDKELIKKLCLEPDKVLSNEEILNLLDQLRRVEELKAQLNERSEELAGAFGSLYEAEQTDLTKLQVLLHTYEIMTKCINALEQLSNYTVRIENQESAMQKCFGTLYSGLDTDWPQVRSALIWAEKFKKDFGSIVATQETFLTNIFTLNEKTALCARYSYKLQREFTGFKQKFDWFLNLFEPDDELRTMQMSRLTAKMNDCFNDLASLEEWIDFRTVRSNCYEIGLKDYIEKIDSLKITTQSIVPIFKKRFFRLWLDSVLPDYPIVASFRHKNQENIIQKFAELDKLQFNINRKRIRSKLIKSLPALDCVTSGMDERRILKGELNKRRGIMPIRLLFKKIPNILLALKPCLMMSPLSVSMFLESDDFRFDTVIFDEASQVRTENAIGAILRGKQVIIAGDSKQLPPTNFFTSSTSEENFDTDSEEEFDSSAGYESLLDEATMFPERTLLWHYRSRHEGLIAFSNAKIYKNNLITFPSSVDTTGVDYIPVQEGVYDRGGSKGNVIEATKVAELVFDHFQNFPNRSLGVIAFSKVQQKAIEEAIDKMRLEHKEFEHFFAENNQDEFFVKNLETVQGDERDTIIFSVGYAKNAAGAMNMNFGPLSKPGGERRLNVAITRAKYNVKLVCSIEPTDIDINRVSDDGPKLLRSYIEFAKYGPSVLANEITESDIVKHDSPFETAVYNFLDRKGYKLATQVGCSGYRIDMAVKHPTLSGHYVLGIECDGASYHSARTARERDRLRQDVLESMGWKIYRIWSTDWIKDPITEGNRLLKNVEKAITEYIVAPV